MYLVRRNTAGARITRCRLVYKVLGNSVQLKQGLAVSKWDVVAEREDLQVDGIQDVV